jgi:hypothetical protein
MPTNWFVTKKSILAGLSGLVASVWSASALPYTVRDQNSVNLGTISAFTDLTKTAAQYYDYTSFVANIPAPPNGPALANTRANVFLFNGSDGLSLITLFKPPVGGDADWKITVNSSGDPVVRVADDAGEIAKSFDGVGLDIFSASWRWGSTADGAAIGALVGPWSALFQQNVLPANVGGFDTIAGVRVHSADGTVINLPANSASNPFPSFRISVPEAGSTVALLGCGMMALLSYGALQRRS